MPREDDSTSSNTIDLSGLSEKDFLATLNQSEKQAYAELKKVSEVDALARIGKVKFTTDPKWVDLEESFISNQQFSDILTGMQRAIAEHSTTRSFPDQAFSTALSSGRLVFQKCDKGVTVLNESYDPKDCGYLVTEERKGRLRQLEFYIERFKTETGRRNWQKRNPGKEYNGDYYQAYYVTTDIAQRPAKFIDPTPIPEKTWLVVRPDSWGEKVFRFPEPVPLEFDQSVGQLLSDGLEIKQDFIDDESGFPVPDFQALFKHHRGLEPVTNLQQLTENWATVQQKRGGALVGGSSVAMFFDIATLTIPGVGALTAAKTAAKTLAWSQHWRRILSHATLSTLLLTAASIQIASNFYLENLNNPGLPEWAQSLLKNLPLMASIAAFMEGANAAWILGGSRIPFKAVNSLNFKRDLFMQKIFAPKRVPRTIVLPFNNAFERINRSNIDILTTDFGRRFMQAMSSVSNTSFPQRATLSRLRHRIADTYYSVVITNKKAGLERLIYDRRFNYAEFAKTVGKNPDDVLRQADRSMDILMKDDIAKLSRDIQFDEFDWGADEFARWDKIIPKANRIQQGSRAKTLLLSEIIGSMRDTEKQLFFDIMKRMAYTPDDLAKGLDQGLAQRYIQFFTTGDIGARVKDVSDLTKQNPKQLQVSIDRLMNLHDEGFIVSKKDELLRLLRGN